MSIRLYDGGATIMIVILALTLIGSLSHNFSDKPHHTGNPDWKGHDNAVEQAAEQVLEALGHGNIDLTPESPEK